MLASTSEGLTVSISVMQQNIIVADIVNEVLNFMIAPGINLNMGQQVIS